MPASCRVCVDELYYVDVDTALCKQCPPVIRPIVIFLAYAFAIILVLLLLYALLRWSWHTFKRSARAVRWVLAVHAAAFERQGAAKFKVRPTNCNARPGWSLGGIPNYSYDLGELYK